MSDIVGSADSLARIRTLSFTVSTIVSKVDLFRRRFGVQHGLDPQTQ